MGCGASRVAAAPLQPTIRVERDPEDFELEPIVLQRTEHVPEFDATFESIETILAQFVTWNNLVNDCENGAPLDPTTRPKQPV
jgi:hypothetical protein